MSSPGPRSAHIIRFWGTLTLLALIASAGLVSLLESRYADLAQPTPYRLQTYAAAEELLTTATKNYPRSTKALLRLGNL